jgi:hypothetical protein
MQSIARSDIDARTKLVLQVLFNANQIEGIETTVTVIIDEEIEVASRVSFVARN